MKPILLIILLCAVHLADAQKIDSIYFHLYTDSLKKGVHNYINVDGKLANGKWLPLTDRQVQFSCDAASFEGNDLIIPADFSPEHITVKAVLKSNPDVVREVTIWIKKKPDDEILPTADEILKSGKSKRRRHFTGEGGF